MNGMKCDYKALINYSITLNKNLKMIADAIFQYENAFKDLSTLSNWNSETRDYIVEKERNLSENFEIINDLINNVNQYVDSVINNYQALEQQMNSMFGG